MKPQNLGLLLMKSSQSNFNLRSPDSYSARSNLIATVITIKNSIKSNRFVRNLLKNDLKKTYEHLKKVMCNKLARYWILSFKFIDQTPTFAKALFSVFAKLVLFS